MESHNQPNELRPKWTNDNTLKSNTSFELLIFYCLSFITSSSPYSLFQILTDEQVALVNFELDVPPKMDYLPHRIPVQVVDKEVMAEAQFLAQQRKYWPSGFL